MNNTLITHKSKVQDRKSAIVFDSVFEAYDIDFIVDGQRKRERVRALAEVSFGIKQGECVAILGANGAGKTTILKLIAGLLVPDNGQVKVEGQVASLLDLGAGFDPDFTGRENILSLAKLYGVPEEQMEGRLRRVVEFSGLGRFIDAPLRCYSTGMYVRLAFSLAIQLDPDILLIDDCLAVGDDEFQKRCIEKILELKQSLKTILFVTHDAGLCLMLAGRGIFLKDGKLLYDGMIGKALSYYTQTVGDIEGIAILERGNLCIIFNNGKLYLNWENTPLLKGFGGFSVIQAEDRQFFSKDLFWKIEAHNEESIIAKGLSLDFGFSQTWQIRLTPENALDLNVKIDSSNAQVLFLQQINLMLSERFNRWSTLQKEGVFPAGFSSARDWKDCGTTGTGFDDGGFIGVFEEAACSQEVLSGILLESAGECVFKTPKVFVTGLEQSAKVISLASSDLAREQAFLGKIRIFKYPQEFKDYLNFKRLNFISERTLEKGNTRILFSENNLRLFYKQCELTGVQGFLSSFFYRQRWIDSRQALWEIRKQDARSFMVGVQWPEFKISQTWQVSLLSEETIEWCIKMEAAEGGDISSCRAALFLSAEYTHWFSSYEEGIFPQDFLWQDMMLENCQRKTVGVYAKNHYPALLFDIGGDPKESLPVIQNSGIDYKSRILCAVTMSRQQCFRGYIKIISRASDVQKHIEDCRKEKLARDLNAEILERQSRSIEQGPLRLIFEDRGVQLFYNELEVTEDCGLRTVFEVEDIHKELNSEHARWQVNKIAQNRARCILRWDDFPCILQSWEIRIENNSFSWSVEMSAYEHTNIYNERAALLLSKNYKQWATDAGEEGDINYDFLEKTKGLPLQNNKCLFVRAKKHLSQGTEYSEIIFETLADKTRDIASLCLDKDRGLGMYFLNVEQQRSHILTPGEYVYFKGRVIFGSGNHTRAVGVSDQMQERMFLPAAGPLEVFFKNGTMQFSWRGKPLSCGLGFYTSFCSAGIWYDSSQAVWSFLNRQPQLWEIRGQWPWIPVIQLWRIQANKKGLLISINTSIYREFLLEAQEVSLLLSCAYQRWQAARQSGRFFEEFSLGDLFRFRLWVGRIAKGSIGVRKRIFSLPAVSLVPAFQDNEAYLVIENANILGQKGRLLQYLKTRSPCSGLQRPGEDNSFKGFIEFD